MNAEHSNESATITWKDVLIILALIFYAWFAYDSDDESSHAPRPGVVSTS